MVRDGEQVVQPPSRLQALLNSRGPMVFIVPDVEQSRELYIASRIVHDLNVYHSLDAEIVFESKMMWMFEEGTTWPPGNIVFIGKSSSTFVRTLLASKKTPFEVTTAGLCCNKQALDPSNGAKKKVTLVVISTRRS